jgi:hypothetical protein
MFGTRIPICNQLDLRRHQAFFLIYNLRFEEGMPIPAQTAKPTTAEPLLEVPLSREVLQNLFVNMLRARLIGGLFRSAVHTTEAVLAGALQNLEDDLVVSATPHPVFSTLLGGDLARLVASKTPITRPADANSRFVVCQPEITISIAAGLALAARRLASRLGSGYSTRGRGPSAAGRNL